MRAIAPRPLPLESGAESYSSNSCLGARHSGGEKALDLGVTFQISGANLDHGALWPRRRHKLQKLFSAFPAGWPGLGLILLRITVGLGAITQGFSAFTASGGPAFIVRVIGFLAIIGGAFSPGRISDACRRRCGNNWLPGDERFRAYHHGPSPAWRCTPSLAPGRDIARAGFAWARSNFAGCAPFRPPRNHYSGEPAFPSGMNTTPGYHPPPRSREPMRTSHRHGKCLPLRGAIIRAFLHIFFSRINAGGDTLYRLDGKNALITGASRGIGRGLLRWRWPRQARMCWFITENLKQTQKRW